MRFQTRPGCDEAELRQPAADRARAPPEDRTPDWPQAFPTTRSAARSHEALGPPPEARPRPHPPRQPAEPGECQRPRAGLPESPARARTAGPKRPPSWPARGVNLEQPCQATECAPPWPPASRGATSQPPLQKQSTHTSHRWRRATARYQLPTSRPAAGETRGRCPRRGAAPGRRSLSGRQRFPAAEWPCRTPSRPNGRPRRPSHGVSPGAWGPGNGRRRFGTCPC